MLGNPNMANIGLGGVGNPYFGEDSQTFYVSQRDVDRGNGYTTSDIGLPDWGIRHATDPSRDNKSWNASYRRCCTANAWAGSVLAAHVMGAKALWNHDALFDYQDRYMGKETQGSFERQQSKFAENMWDTYRPLFGPVWPSQSTNQPPLANAGQDRTVTDTDGDGSADVTLDGTGSMDPDGAIGSFVWTEGGTRIATGDRPTVTLSVGEHTITLTVTDDSGLIDTDTVTITVEAPDESPPSIVSVNASRDSVEILFDEALDRSSAENIGNYAVNSGILVVSALLNSTLNRVTLSTSAHSQDVTYTLTVTNVQDTAGNFMPETTLSYQYYGNLIGFWQFNENTGTTAEDSSGNGNTATLVNGPIWTGWGEISLDGIDDAVKIPTADWNVNSGTVILFAYAEDFTDVRYFFGHTVGSWSNRIQLYAGNASLCLGLGDSHAVRTGIENLVPQTWYHIALTWDGTNYVVYVDGVAKANGLYTGLTALNTFADIGNTGNTSSRDTEAFDGLFDDVRIYNQALTADEVLDLFNEKSPLVFSPIGDKEVDEGSNLTFEVITQDPNVVVDINDHNLPAEPDFTNNIFSWTPTYDDAGSYEVTFVAPHGVFEDFETITITVNNINRKPVIEPLSNKTIDENTTVIFTVNATDPDGDDITCFVDNPPAGAAFTDNTFKWTPGYDQAGVYIMSFVATDGELEGIESIIITVNNVNRAPVLTSIGDKSVNENETLSFAINASDADGDTITYSAQNLPSGAILSGNTFIWKPQYDQAGSYEVTFVASDGQLQDSEIITITVADSATTLDGLVDYWKFDELTGAIAEDSSGNGNTATLVNGPIWTGWGEISLDGIDDAVKIPTADWNVNSGTVTLFAYGEDFSGVRYLFGHTIGSWSNRIQLYAGNASLCLGLGDSHAVRTGIENLVPQTWYHIALTWDGASYAVYVNGIKKAAGPYTGLTALNTFADVGNTGNTSSRNREAFNGLIDDVRIYDRALTADEVGTLADTSRGLVGSWQFDNGSGTTAEDSSGNGNTATLVNGPIWTGWGQINLDGVDDAVEIPTADWNVSTGTIVLSAYGEDFSGVRYLFGHTTGSWSNRMQLYAHNAKLCLGLGNSHKVRTNIENLDLQTWYHIALTWDGAEYAVYVNGIKKAAGPYTGLTALNTFADVGNTGNTSFRNKEAFNGLIDDVRVYNRALTADEVGRLADTLYTHN
jgi:hypothetical protein